MIEGEDWEQPLKLRESLLKTIMNGVFSSVKTKRKMLALPGGKSGMTLDYCKIGPY